MRPASNSRHRARAAIASGASLALLLALSACGGSGSGDDPGSRHLDLVIGDVLPLSGASKQLGESGRKASELAVKRIDQAIADTGSDHNIRAISGDQGADPSTASRVAAGLVGGGAGCLTGPWTAAAVEQTANDVAIPGETPLISPVPATRAVTELSDHDLVNSTALPVSTEGTALADAIERDLGGADGITVNVASIGDRYGDELTQDFTQEWQDRDGTVGAEDPDAELVVGDPEGFSELVSQLSTGGGWDPERAWGSDQLVDPGLPALAGSAANGMRAIAPGSPQGEETSSAFDADFESAAPRSVPQEPFAAQEFDATVLCYLAAVAAGSTDGRQMADELVDITAPGGEKYGWQELPDAIKALERGEDIDYTGASGPLDMGVHGNPIRGVFDVYRYTPNGLEIAGEVPAAQANPATP